MPLPDDRAMLQFVREFARLGLTRSVGGVLGLAMTRELTPVITSIILAGPTWKSGTLLEHGTTRMGLASGDTSVPEGHLPCS